jgi:hypothetical protein
MYDDKYFKSLKFQTRWKPNVEFYKETFDLFIDLAVSNDGWYANDRMTKKWKKSLTEGQFCYVWNHFDNKNIREGLVSICTESSSELRPWTKDILTSLYESIPVDFEVESNSIRSAYVKFIDKDYDYLSEVTRARIANQERIVAVWTVAGMSDSKRASFYNFLWDTTKRGRGTVDKRLEILRASMSKNVYSDKILDHCAKRGTKRMKRLAVGMLGEELHRYTRYEKTAKAASAEEILFLESKMLLFATTDDANVIENLVEYISSDNLPWVMPSASKFPWLLRKINRRIERSRDSGS